MASSVAASSASAAAASAGSKRAREPTDKELGQQACLDSVFSRAASHTIMGAIKGLESGSSSASKKARTTAGSAAAAKPLKKADGWADEGEDSKPSSNPFVALMDAKSSGFSASSSRQQQLLPAPHSSRPYARTANGAPSFASTKSPVLDLFYHLARGYPRESVRHDLSQAWMENPENALRVLAHARDCHGRDGKGERLVALYGLVWLREHKPKTYLLNLMSFLRHGYFKDLLTIVDMVDQGANWNPPVPSAGPPAGRRGGRGGRGGRGRGGRYTARRAPAAAAAATSSNNAYSRNTIAASYGGTSASSVQSAGPLGSSQLELRLFAELLKADSLKLKKWRQEKKAWAAHQASLKAAAEQQMKDAEEATYAAKLAQGSGSKPLSSYILPSSTAWFDDEDAPVEDEEDDEWEEVSTASVTEARGRVEKMEIKEGHMGDAPESAASSAPAAAAPAAAKPPAAAASTPVEPAANCFISLAAKYAPSEGKHWGGLAKKIARILFGGGGAGGAEHKHGGFQNAAHMQSCLKRYRSLLSTLRGHLCITERLACANRWPSINFNAVPSKCHQLLKRAFMRHCPERYAAYLASLKRGEKHVKINVQGLAPHELVKYYLENPRAAVNETVEAAWRALVARVEESGTFAAAVAVVDVSGSMAGLPMIVAIALGLLVAALTKGPFRGRVLTFHERPSWHLIRGSTLKEQVACLASAEWGGSTNFGASLDLILDLAVTHRLAQKDLPSTLFAFSDMQFDAASGCGDRFMRSSSPSDQSTYHSLSAKFTRAGYTIPQIVFWNLNGSLNKDCPVQMDQPGCALMSGFSAQLLNVFLRAQVAADPAAQAAEAKPEDNPLHPLAIMMESIKEYAVEIDESER